jgi:hypothetical protein
MKRQRLIVFAATLVAMSTLVNDLHRVEPRLAACDYQARPEPGSTDRPDCSEAAMDVSAMSASLLALSPRHNQIVLD